MIVVQLHQNQCVGQEIRVAGLAVEVSGSGERQGIGKWGDVLSHDGYALFDDDDGNGEVDLVDWTGKLRVLYQPEPLQLVCRFQQAAWDLWWLQQSLLPEWWEPNNPKAPVTRLNRSKQPAWAQAAVTHHGCGSTCLVLPDGTEYSSTHLRSLRTGETIPFVPGEHGDPIPDETIAAAVAKLHRPLPEHRVERVGV